MGGPEHRRASAVLSRTALPALHPLAQRRGAPLPCWQNAALMRCMPGLPAHNGRRPASQHGRPMRLPARSTGSVLFLPQWLETTVASAAAASSSAVLLRALPTSHAKRQRLNASAQTAATFKALFKVAVLGGSRCPRCGYPRYQLRPRGGHYECQQQCWQAPRHTPRYWQVPRPSHQCWQAPRHSHQY